MSFPSAQKFLRANPGSSAEAALFFAIQTDTPLGYEALAKISRLVFRPCADPLSDLRHYLGGIGELKGVPRVADSVLRCEMRGQGLKVDFDPNSEIAKQIGRIMTDAARPLVGKRLGVAIGFCNCHGVLISPDKKDVSFTAAEQIAWQISIDC